MGVTIRHYFNSMHARKGQPTWTWAATVVIFIAIAWLSTFPGYETYDEAETRAMTPYETRFAQAEGFEDAHQIVTGRCSMCHAREPAWNNMQWAPKDVFLETEADVARHARDIYLQAAITHAMPPANLTMLSDDDRRTLAAWYRAGRS